MSLELNSKAELDAPATFARLRAVLSVRNKSGESGEVRRAGVGAMPVEIERKFLVANEEWRKSADQGTKITQGYIINAGHCSVRVRICSDGNCTLTTKLPRGGISRYEFEHPIELREAEGLIDLCGDAIVEKVRFKIETDGLTWEVDAFEGLNEGLTVAEIELDDEDQAFTHPGWLGEEVTGRASYQNSKLAVHPFSRWTETTDAPAILAASDLA